jgi:hypothetical protein
MHILEAFATSSGLKISKPYIYEKYYPLNFDKYIIIETNDSKYQSKNYDYWQEVISLILPSLKENNINILQICGQNDPRLLNAYTVTGYTANQKAYLIKNSVVYIGSNLLGLQLASNYSKKIVGLYGNIYASQNKPYWSNEEDLALIQGFDEKTKPSYAPQENPKVINNIKPDILAQSILNSLNIKYKIKNKFKSIGASYMNKTIELVPNMVINPASFGAPNVIVRMDIEFNENFLAAQLAQSKCLIITNKTISENLIKTYKANITQVVYKIEKENDPLFVNLLKNENISFALISALDQEDINNIKIHYMDLGLILKLNYKSKEDYDCENIKYYKSNHFILSNSKLYMSEAAVEKDLPIKDFDQNIQEIIDTDTFWKHADNYAFLVD